MILFLLAINDSIPSWTADNDDDDVMMMMMIINLLYYYYNLELLILISVIFMVFISYIINCVSFVHHLMLMIT